MFVLSLNDTCNLFLITCYSVSVNLRCKQLRYKEQEFGRSSLVSRKYKMKFQTIYEKIRLKSQKRVSKTCFLVPIPKKTWGGFAILIKKCLLFFYLAEKKYTSYFDNSLWRLAIFCFNWKLVTYIIIVT